jgi:hypothetical protein
MKALLFSFIFLFLLTLGPPLPKAISGFSMLEMHGDTYVFGGSDESFYSQSLIYQFSCSSGLCSWTTLNMQLKFGRHDFVAIPVQDNFCFTDD